jgi:hypothetical protein
MGLLCGAKTENVNRKHRRETMEREDAIELYKVLKRQNATALSTYHSHIQHYRVLIAAIIGASFATVVAILKLFPQHQKLTGWLMLSTLVFPVTNVLLCCLAIKQCDHPYRIFLETITVQAKLEPIIGLIERPLEGIAEDAPFPFPKDDNFIPERWLEPGKSTTAKEFVDKHIRKGTNKLAHRLFIILAAANLVLIAAIVVGSLYMLLV